MHLGKSERITMSFLVSMFSITILEFYTLGVFAEVCVSQGCAHAGSAGLSDSPPCRPGLIPPGILKIYKRRCQSARDVSGRGKTTRHPQFSEHNPRKSKPIIFRVEIDPM